MAGDAYFPIEDITLSTWGLIAGYASEMGFRSWYLRMTAWVGGDKVDETPLENSKYGYRGMWLAVGFDLADIQ